ncbi:MAG: hypothetical protein ABI467_05555 [Kofleriaceae bacterium]
MRCSWLIALAACGGPAPPQPRPIDPSPQPAAAPADPHAVLFARVRADEALHQGVALDYERPFKTKPVDRSATARLFGDACRLGDKRACLIEAELATGADRFQTIEASCAAGDLLSCRALPLDEHEPRFPSAPGAMSRRVECQQPHLGASCEVAALHRECGAGFPVACYELNVANPDQPMSAAEITSWPKLSERGCLDGIASECLNLSGYGSDRDQFEVAQRLCNLRPGECVELAEIEVKRHDLTAARDSFERTCQYGDHLFELCAALGTEYLAGTYPEPVPGRARALLDWACPKLHKGNRDRFPACSSAPVRQR